MSESPYSSIEGTEDHRLPVPDSTTVDHLCPNVATALLFAARDDVAASDIHFRAGDHPWLQIGGSLERHAELETPSEAEIDAVVRWIGGVDVSTTIIYPQDARQRWRAQTMRDASGLGITLRRLPQRPPDFELLGEGLEQARDIATVGEGLVVVAGETGSGKTTTLAAIVNLINKTRDSHILTIEAPIEFEYESKRSLFTQREVGTHVETAELAFHSALRSAPDVILLGEQRTEAEAELCLDAALSGHLVLTTMHASSVGAVVERLTGNRGELARSKIAQALRMSLCLRLLPDMENPRARHLFAEIVPRDGALESLIRKGETSQMKNHVVNKLNGGLNEQLVNGVRQGWIDVFTAREACIDVDDLERRLKGVSGASRSR